MEVYFIRHGKTKGNSEHRYIGRTDEAILESSKEELKKLNMPKLDNLYVSPMIRCIETSQCLYPHMEYTIVEAFKEMYFGDFEGKTYNELKELPEFHAWYNSRGQIAIKNGESLLSFQRRCVEGFEPILQENYEKGSNNIGFVVHGGTIMALLDHYSHPHQNYQTWDSVNGGGYSGIVEKRDDKFVITSLKRFGQEKNMLNAIKI